MKKNVIPDLSKPTLLAEFGPLGERAGVLLPEPLVTTEYSTTKQECQRQTLPLFTEIIGQ